MPVVEYVGGKVTPIGVSQTTVENSVDNIVELSVDNIEIDEVAVVIAVDNIDIDEVVFTTVEMPKIGTLVINNIQ